MTTSLPANASPTVLPVERLLPAPSPDATALVRLVTEPLTLEAGKEPTVWLLDRPHPLAGIAKIVRMYHREDGGVDVYSSDGQMFVRTYVPERCVRFFDEAMSEDTFVAFIEEAEEEEEEEEPEEPEEPEELEPAAPAAAAPPNAAPGAAT